MLITLWLEGPPFLKHSKSKWPNQPSIFLNNRSDIELKKEYVTLHVEKEDFVCSIPNSYVHRFSSWLKFLRCTALIIRFTRNLKNRTKAINRLNSLPDVPELTLEEINEAERVILIATQFYLFPDEGTTYAVKKN